jgi:hypothetical protein
MNSVGSRRTWTRRIECTRLITQSRGFETRTGTFRWIHSAKVGVFEKRQVQIRPESEKLPFPTEKSAQHLSHVRGTCKRSKLKFSKSRTKLLSSSIVFECASRIHFVHPFFHLMWWHGNRPDGAMACNLSSERITLVAAPTRGARSYDFHYFQQSPERNDMKQNLLPTFNLRAAQNFTIRSFQSQQFLPSLFKTSFDPIQVFTSSWSFSNMSSITFCILNWWIEWM